MESTNLHKGKKPATRAGEADAHRAHFLNKIAAPVRCPQQSLVAAAAQGVVQLRVNNIEHIE